MIALVILIEYKQNLLPFIKIEIDLFNFIINMVFILNKIYIFQNGKQKTKK